MPPGTRPQLWIDRHAAASASSLVTMMPPSPDVRFLLDWNENDPASSDAAGGPVAPRGAVRVRGVLEHEESVPRRAMASSASMSAGCPAKCTGMIARVRGVIAASTACGSMLKVAEIDVDEHRHAVGLDDRGGRREERVRGNDDLVFGLQARGHERDAQRDGAVDDGDAVAAAVHRREPLLELGDLVAGQPAPFAAAQRGEHARLVGLVEDRPGRKRTGADGCATQQCEGRVMPHASLTLDA